MHKSKIFLVGETENSLVEMVETPFDKEDILQVLLERYSDLLPGDQIDPEEPRRWLLVSREMGIPNQEQGGNIWSLDHLFLDQDGIPTFIECKRAADTRARREVVAQMLDYAANGTLYWSMNALRTSAEEIAKKHGHNLEEDIQALVASEEPTSADIFWKTVEQNLRNGHVRLVFVADRVPQELRRLVEFLNEKMTDVEVLAVEIKQYLGKGSQKAVVPRVIGLTETAIQNKGLTGSHTHHVNREEFIGKCEPEAAQLFNYLLDRAGYLNHPVYWGTLGLSIGYVFPNTGIRATFMYAYPPNRFEVYFDYIKLDEADEKMFRKELAERFNFKVSGKKTLRTEITPVNIEKLKDAVDWIYAHINELMTKESTRMEGSENGSLG